MKNIIWVIMQIQFLILTTISSIDAIELAAQVVNGRDTTIAHRPFQVSLQVASRHFCGGSILNEKYVVTAAHCTVKKTSSDITVVSGTTDLRDPKIISRVTRTINHANYDPINHHNDIALIEVSTPFPFSANVQPVHLPKPHAVVPAGTAAVISGWGRLLNSHSEKPNILQEAVIYVMNQIKCDVALHRLLAPTTICANDPNNRRGSCTGDSGGPLTADNVLIGLVSWGTHDPNCASPRYPTVYTRVSEYIDWMQRHQS